jgi:hypothetical protein
MVTDIVNAVKGALVGRYGEILHLDSVDAHFSFGPERAAANTYQGRQGRTARVVIQAKTVENSIFLKFSA